MSLRSQDVGPGAKDLLQVNLLHFHGVASLCPVMPDGRVGTWKLLMKMREFD